MFNLTSLTSSYTYVGGPRTPVFSDLRYSNLENSLPPCYVSELHFVKTIWNIVTEILNNNSFISREHLTVTENYSPILTFRRMYYHSKMKGIFNLLIMMIMTVHKAIVVE